jgi:hypothetical protein
MKLKILFILKKRHINYGVTTYGDVNPYGYTLSSGLVNSATFVNDMLVANGFESTLVEVTDNNDIDREVTKAKPDVVIIEAFWVVPSKFDVLRKLHPDVQWVVRLHSEIPFLANEGVALDWIQKLVMQPNMTIALNSSQTTKDFIHFFKAKYSTVDPRLIENKIVFLPNYYPVDKSDVSYNLDSKDTIDVGCFGAIRPMKNQLIQAFAAVEWARKNDMKLRFHINALRVESGDNALKNIRSMFSELGTDYQLVEHEWLDHDQFIELVRTMDIGLQMSFSETFNIVAADFINNGVPFVGSKEIPFVFPLFQADATSVSDIVKKMGTALKRKKYMNFFSPSKTDLMVYVDKAQKIWVKYFTD